MAEAEIYPGINKEDLESLEEMLKGRGIEYSISPNTTSGGYRSMVSIDGEVYHNSATLLRHLDKIQPKI